MKLTAIIIAFCQIWHTFNAQETPCITRKCADIPNHVCVGEKGAALWPKKCLEHSEDLCFNNGAACEWTDWLDQDNPSGKGDYEKAPDGCEIQSYQIQLVSGGPVYNDVANVPQVLNDNSYVHCVNADQPGCKVGANGYPSPYFQKACCQDYKVRYCCKPPEPPCEWTNWLDQDNPGGTGDWEKAPDGCEIQSYQVQLVSGGPVYNDVATMPQILNDNPYVHCVNADQPGCKVRANGWPISLKGCCHDYKARYCCNPPKPKCYCCPKIDDEPCGGSICKANGRRGRCYGPNELKPWGLTDSKVPCGKSESCTCWIKNNQVIGFPA